MTKITKGILIGDILRADKGVVPILLNSGLHCLGCPSAQGETLEEACDIHGIAVEQLVEELNAYLQSREVG